MKKIGLIPAGGIAERVSPLPCSKEIYPVGFDSTNKGQSKRQIVACDCLLKGMRLAGVKRAYFIVRKGKWDIPAYMGDGKMIDMHLAYLIMDLPYGVPFTLDQAYPFIEDAIILFGFPDIVFEPKDALVHLLSKQSESGADLVLGLFPAHEPPKMDMVELDLKGCVRGITIKPTKTNSTFTWILAVWNHRFTQFMHKFIMENKISRDSEKTSIRNTVQRELFMGDVIQAAIQDDINIDKLIFPDGKFRDIGNPRDLAKVVQGVTI